MDRNVGATTNAPDSFDCHGMIYQWGRKDPFTSAGTFTIINEDYSYQVDGERPIYNILNEELPKCAPAPNTTERSQSRSATRRYSMP